MSTLTGAGFVIKKEAHPDDYFVVKNACDRAYRMTQVHIQAVALTEVSCLRAAVAKMVLAAHLWS